MKKLEDIEDPYERLIAGAEDLSYALDVVDELSEDLCRAAPMHTRSEVENARTILNESELPPEDIQPDLSLIRDWMRVHG